MTKLLSLLLFALLVAVGLGAPAVAGPSNAGPYRVEIATDPGTVPVGKANLLIAVSDAGGKPVEGATVRAIAAMAGMNMGERVQTARPGDRPGLYVAPVAFPMGGIYGTTVTVEGPLGRGETTVELKTGEATSLAGESASPGAGIVGLWPWAVGIALALFVLYRVRRTGQTVDLRGVFTRQVGLSLLLLGGAVALVVWVVNTRRRDGAMTPIEAQAMEMNTPAPEGTLAVTLAKVGRRAFAPTVTYTGQAVGDVEQDVVPRVGGTIEWMPFYVGDQVKKGQLLARLDTSQLDPEVATKGASVGRAREGVNVSALDYQEALNGVGQARAEVGMARGDLAEARASLEATTQGRATAAADLKAALAEVDSRLADLASERAGREFLRAEAGRMRTLLDQGAVTRSENQRAQSDAAQADARVRAAENDVAKARAAVNAVRAAQRRAEAEIAAARRKVQSAEAGVRAKEAAVRTAQAGAGSAKAKIGQSQAAVRESVAGLKGATVQQGYAQLRAETDGVVTQRTISPGQTVTAGQAILKVARISPIRLQANVAESDLARIAVGAKVTVSRRGAKETPIEARVTSVAPSLDAGARTGTVEAVYANPDRRFLPGQFVTMEIATDEAGEKLTVPLAAVQRDAIEGGVLTSGTRAYVWVAKEGSGEALDVERVAVELGETSGESVAVRSGLTAGQSVIVSPPMGLTATTRVTSATPLVAIAKETASPTVRVTTRGFEPDTISLPAGKAATVVFRRETNETCGTEIVFPDLGLTKKLPLNEDVKVSIPAGKARELTFACGMDMLKGKVVVR